MGPMRRDLFLLKRGHYMAVVEGPSLERRMSLLGDGEVAREACVLIGMARREVIRKRNGRRGKSE